MACKECYEVHGPVDPRLDTYDWKEAFKYAEPHLCEAGHSHGPTEGILAVPTTPFSRESVAEIIHVIDGEADRADWIGVFKLKDGRYACLRAWCDYTGWG